MIYPFFSKSYFCALQTGRHSCMLLALSCTIPVWAILHKHNAREWYESICDCALGTVAPMSLAESSGVRMHVKWICSPQKLVKMFEQLPVLQYSSSLIQVGSSPIVQGSAGRQAEDSASASVILGPLDLSHGGSVAWQHAGDGRCERRPSLLAMR
jgi:hypothetical protein